MLIAKDVTILTPEDLRKFRTKFKLSQQDLAEYAGFRSYNTILKYENKQIKMVRVVQMGFLKLFETFEMVGKK